MFSCCAWAGTTHDDLLLLRAQAAIFPKIILLDKQLEEKQVNNEIVITIVATNYDDRIERQLQSLIEEKYKNKLGNKKLTINVTSIDNFNQDFVATAYIILHGSESLFNKVVSHASNNDRIVFSYSYTDFKYNALISLLVKEKTYIYLNKSAIQLYDIKFSPVFYKITKIIE